jgi:hypothetical protein
MAMLYEGADSRVGELAVAVERRMPEMITNTVEQIISEMPVYGQAEYVSREELTGSVARNLGFALRALQGQGAPELSQATTTGRVRALQGAPLPELLRAYRIGLTEVWYRFVDLIGAEESKDLAVLVAATTAIWALIDDYAEALTTAYRVASAELILTNQARRSALVEALLAGGSSTEGMLWDIARVLGLSLDGDFVVVAAETPALGEEPLPQIELRLRELHHASAWRLTPDLHAGVVSLRHPRASEAILELLRDHDTARVGLSPVYSGLGNTAQALHLARVALSTLSVGTAGTVQFTDSPLAGLVASSPESAVQLAHQVLRPILDLDGEDRNVLLLTLRAWFGSQGSTRLTAEKMYCHPNTIRLRLKRIAEELGRSLSDPGDIAEVGTALRALQMFPGTARLPPPAGH